MHQKLVDLSTKLLQCVSKKLKALKKFQTIYKACIKVDDSNKILDLISDTLAQKSHSGSLPGQIADYKDAHGLLDKEHL